MTLATEWMRKHNEERTHDALGDITPVGYLVAKKSDEIFNNAWTWFGATYRGSAKM